MPDLVAAPARGRWFVERMLEAWEAGHAVLPVDPRLPDDARELLLKTMRPTVVIGDDGTRHAADGDEVEDGDAIVVATSGTTGEPKGVVLTHDALAASARATSAALGVDPAADRWLACLPLAHVGGLSVVTRALVTGTGVDVLDEFDADAVDRSDATLVSLVGTALRRVDVSRWRRILLGGGAPPPDRPAHAVATYGLTETGSGVVYDGWPLEGVELRIVAGEVQIRGPMLLRTYRDGTSPLTADGWLATGDEGALAADGKLSVRGRRGDMIITGGENVWPEAVERRLEAHPAVERAAVIGRPDSEWGQRVVAVVVPTDASSPPSLDALRDWVRETQPTWSAPKQLDLVESLPTTSLGKVRRDRLRDR
ncbi:MAG: AMP-binding protein [Actinomycetota bacterium]